MPATPHYERKTVISREGRLWLAASALLWATGWLKGINLILLLAYLLVGMWGLNWLLARRSVRGLRPVRRRGAPVFAGTPVLWEVEVENGGPRPRAGGVVVDQGPDHALAWPVPRLGPGESVRLRREVVLPRRGPYLCPPLRVSSSYPFGLVRHEVRRTPGDDLLVLPRLGTLHAGRLRRWLQQTARPDERTRRARRQMAEEVEFHGLRTFRTGDSPRWIHWRTSARRGELMVREFDQGMHHDLLLFVEPYLAPDDSNRDALEAALSLAATVCWAWCREGGDRILLAVAGEMPRVVVGAGGRELALQLLSGLAEEPGTHRPDAGALIQRLRPLPLPPGPALVVSSRPAGGVLAGAVESRLARPAARIDAVDPPTFYQPPAMPPRRPTE